MLKQVGGDPWFIAIPIEAGEWYDSLKQPTPPGGRFLHPSDLHLTAIYLGRCGEDAARAAFAHVTEARPGWPEQVTLGELVPMGNKRRPSAFSAVLSSGADETRPLLLQAHQALELSPRNELIPHVTLVRPRRNIDKPGRVKLAEWAAQLPALEQPVQLECLALYTWTAPMRDGRRYQVVSRWTG